MIIVKNTWYMCNKFKMFCDVGGVLWYQIQYIKIYI